MTDFKQEIPKRLGIYVYWDGQAEAKRYALYYIERLLEVCQKVLVVVNGKLKEDGIQSFQSLGAEVMLRSNEGYDFAGWRDGFQHIGWEKVKTFDEVVLCNSSCYGPVGGSFQPMFDKMAEKEADFWGISRYPQDGRKIPAHIQSYFFVFRKRLAGYSQFQKYWETLPTFKSWKQAVRKGEAQFTRLFEVQGFKGTNLVDCSQFEKRFHNPTILFPIELMEEGSVLVKKKVFTEHYGEFFSATNASIGKKTLTYLRHRKFPVEDIFEDLNKTMPPSAIRENLHLIHYPDTDTEIDLSSKKIGLIFFVYFNDLVEDCLRYIRTLPKHTSIVIVSSKLDLLETYKESLSEDGFIDIDFRVQPNRGRNEAAYFLTGKDIWKKADYICLAHDKKSSEVKPRISGEYYMEHCLVNLLDSNNYVKGVIKIFEEHPEYGLLEPPPPLFAAWEDTLGNLWGRNEQVAKQFLERVPGDYFWDPRPIAPFGSMMWVRKEAFKPLLDVGLKLEDFPEEPIPTDSTLLHALERLYPTFSQKAGFLTAWIMAKEYSKVFLDNMYYQMECNYGSHGYKRNMIAFIKRRLRKSPTLYQIAKEIKSYF